MRWALIGTLLFASDALAQGDAVRIDELAKEMPRSLRADSLGQLFVGGADGLFVYEPKEHGGYHPRKLLYRFPAYSEINDIEIRGKDLYVLTRTALYVFPDGVRKRENLQAKKLLWGIPLGADRQGFRALAWGPQGDLYLAVGAERWGYWTFFSGATKTPYHGAGGIVRVKPDGSGLAVVARGLCYPDGLAFDRYWNLFSCDSDKNNIGRLMHITPHAYFGGAAATLQPMLDGRRTSRIAALGYHDGMLLAARGEDLLRLSIEPRGASFQTTEFAFLPRKVVAVTSGRDGRLFGISAAGELLMLTSKDVPLEPCDLVAAAPNKLWQELSNPSWQRRYRAHIEMLRRGGEFLKNANKRLLHTNASDPAFHHLIWLAAKSEQGSLNLLGLVEHPDPKVRVHAIRALTEFPAQLHEEPIFTKYLLDENPQVQHAAMLAYFAPKIAWGRPMQREIERGQVYSRDTYLRQTAVRLLAEKATRAQIENLGGRFDVEMRLAGVLAAGFRLTLPSATRPLGPNLPLDKFRAESAYVIEYADGKVDLREHGRVGTYTIAQHWKVDMLTEDQNLLFKMLRRMLADQDPTVRARAAYFLDELGDMR